ncbi:transcription factor E74 isoform B [Danaus plexippus plexippus]|uniref:Transcription factor E74 isoform B n=1 Tax=Danaus plexippus plexippus TaxID=278856 RepID=A0A212F5G7_DANPL|nr:transcription factor E74 isoform B [Danaus plexippus plexippus]
MRTVEGPGPGGGVEVAGVAGVAGGATGGSGHGGRGRGLKVAARKLDGEPTSLTLGARGSLGRALLHGLLAPAPAPRHPLYTAPNTGQYKQIDLDGREPRSYIINTFVEESEIRSRQNKCEGGEHEKFIKNKEEVRGNRYPQLIPPNVKSAASSRLPLAPPDSFRLPAHAHTQPPIQHM